MLTTATMTGAARELSGPKDDPRLSRSRFRNSNLPAQAILLDSGHEKSTEVSQQVLTRGAVPVISPAVQSTSEWQFCKLRRA